ncbi:hypothetical protein [Methylocystis iwaonis]|uniref:hypothetical protein n=1 Tax=Methylocystis iwaonis TaxID=2885079 RepID=UPI0024931AB0|nr:hypothetical protein [Methylocystis iwaonis]
MSECIESEIAANEHGIATCHERMKNGELRFRLRKLDGTAYIRTESTEGGWQESHYHKEVLETYIVQNGWIVYAELRDDRIILSKYADDQIFTTSPGIIHNVYLSPGATIHTVKHGKCSHPDRNTDDLTKIFDEKIRGTSIEELIEIRVREPILDVKIQKYNEEYRHFDNLIWQLPNWSTATFALSVAGISYIYQSENPLGLSKILYLSKELMAATLLVLTSSILLVYSHALFRFRFHQSRLKAYRQTSWWMSASTWLNILITAEAAFLVLLTLGILRVNILIAAIVLSPLLIGIIITREHKIRFRLDDK